MRIQTATRMMRTSNEHRQTLTTLRRLVRTVTAIQVMIADEMLGDALLILALELHVITGLIVCYEETQRGIKVQIEKKNTNGKKDLNKMRGHLLQPARTPSSAPSGQSLSPSHFQRWGTQ